MDAIALPMFADPTAMPIPRRDSPLVEASLFATLVADIAKGEEQKSEIPAETQRDAAAPQPDSTSLTAPLFIVPQAPAQTDSAPPFPKAIVSGLDRLLFDEQEPVSPRATLAPPAVLEEPIPDEPSDISVPKFDTPAPQFDSPTPLLDNDDHAAGGGQHVRASSATNVPDRQHDSLTHSPLESREAPRRVLPQEPSHELRLQIEQLVQYSAGIGLGAPETQTDDTSGEIESSGKMDAPDAMMSSAKPRGPSEIALPARPLSSEARASLAAPLIRPTVEPSPKDLSDRAGNPTRSIADDARAFAPDHPKPMHGPDGPKPAEPLNPPPGLVRAAETLPPPTGGAQASTATTLAPIPDSISVPPDSISVPPSTGNVTAIADSSAEAQVKVAAATRDGQQTAEMQTLALHIAARSARGDSRFTIRLDPPELGRIEVNLSVSSHGQAQAVLAVEKPQTLDLLLRDAPMLERALKDAGLELGSNLSFSLKEDGQPQFSRDNPYAPPTRTLELVPVEPTNTNPLLNTSLVEQLYGLRTARLDITV